MFNISSFETFLSDKEPAKNGTFTLSRVEMRELIDLMNTNRALVPPEEFPDFFSKFLESLDDAMDFLPEYWYDPSLITIDNLVSYFYEYQGDS